MVKVQKGFTLIELMIVIAIIGILAAVAVPQYSQYTKRAEYTEIKLAVSPIKSQVEVCYELNDGPGPSGECGTAVANPTVRGQVTNAMLTRAANGSKVGSVTVTGGSGDPVITVAPDPANSNFALADEYILTGTVGAGGITNWMESGQGCNEGYC